MDIVYRVSDFQLATGLEPKGNSPSHPHIQAWQEASTVPRGNHPARPRPQPPATLLPKLCPGKPLTSPTRLNPSGQINTLPLMLRESLLPETSPPVSTLCGTNPHCHPFHTCALGSILHPTINSSTESSTLLKKKERGKKNFIPKFLLEMRPTFVFSFLLEIQMPSKRALTDYPLIIFLLGDPTPRWGPHLTYPRPVPCIPSEDTVSPAPQDAEDPHRVLTTDLPQGTLDVMTYTVPPLTRYPLPD